MSLEDRDGEAVPGVRGAARGARGDLRVCLAVPEDRLSQAHLDDGRCGDGLRRGEHGLPGFERCGPIVALEAIDGIER